MDEQTALSHVAQIPSALLRETTLNGTPQEVIEQAAQWRDCGVWRLVAEDGMSKDGRNRVSHKTNVVGFSKAAAKVSSAAPSTRFIPARAGGFA